MLAYRLRRRPNIKTTVDQSLEFAGDQGRVSNTQYLKIEHVGLSVNVFYLQYN